MVGEATFWLSPPGSDMQTISGIFHSNVITACFGKWVAILSCLWREWMNLKSELTYVNEPFINIVRIKERMGLPR